MASRFTTSHADCLEVFGFVRGTDGVTRLLISAERASESVAVLVVGTCEARAIRRCMSPR
jgi:hypothetical protein